MIDILSVRENAGLNASTEGVTHHLRHELDAWRHLTINMNDAAVTLVRQDNGTAGETLLQGNVLIVDPQSSGASENLLLPPEADCNGLLITIYNVGGESIALQNDAGGLGLRLSSLNM